MAGAARITVEDQIKKIQDVLSKRIIVDGISDGFAYHSYEIELIPNRAHSTGRDRDNISQLLNGEITMKDWASNVNYNLTSDQQNVGLFKGKLISLNDNALKSIRKNIADYVKEYQRAYDLSAPDGQKGACVLL